MIELHQYPPVWGLSSLSPFCIKVELFLKVHQIGYKSVYQNDPRRGPKGKMPVIKDGGQVIADSHFILKHLKTRFDCSSTNYSSSEQAGEALAFRKMIEESLYFSLLYSRWVDPEGWKVIHYHFKNMFPLGLGTLALKFIRNQLLQQAKAQGIGRHSKHEVYSLALE